jgi:L-threonylcarbamoyladenylate synthase
MTEHASAGGRDTVDRVVAALQAGQAVVLPTDTVYGVAALPADGAAVDRLFALKGRAADVPIAVLCADVDQALGLADPAAAEAARPAAERWWPGPLTLVLPRRAGVVLHLGEPAGTIGLRVPDHALVRDVARIVGPLATTSANRHGEPTPATATEAAASLGDGVGLVVDGGPSASSSSTVIDATTAPWRVLRGGPIPAGDVIAAADG